MRYLITTGMHAHYSQEMAKLEAVYSGCGEEEQSEEQQPVKEEQELPRSFCSSL